MLNHNPHVLIYLMGLYVLCKYNCRSKTAKFKAFNMQSYLDSHINFFSKPFKEYEDRCSRYCRFNFFSPQLCSVEFFITWPGLKNWKSYSEETGSSNIQADFQGSVCRNDPFSFLKTN